MNLQSLVDGAKKIVFFGGAGVSTESGIPDFRSIDGLYNQKYKYPPEEILSHSFFMNNTKDFYDFYREKLISTDALPNNAHIKLAEMEKAGKLSYIITQNIDGLHQKAGSKNVIELHGNIYKNNCMSCGKDYTISYIQENEIPHCECGGLIKPQVVLYEEALDDKILSVATNALENADLLIIGGTSLGVYPAATLIVYYKGDNLVLINKTETPLDKTANLVLRENIASVLEKLKV